MLRGFALLLLAAPAAGACQDDGPAEPDAHVHDEDAGAGCEASAADVPACPEIVGTAFPCEGQAHVTSEEDLVWQTDPPASGPHYGQWETVPGEHEEPVPRGNWVHNLEHGWVVLLHNCPAGCEPELAVLRSVLAERPDERILLTPDPLLPPPRFAVVSWTWIDRTDAPDLATLTCFVDQHEGRAPEDVP